MENAGIATPRKGRPRPTVGRRTVLRTAAWATPAVLVAAAAPAFAASPVVFPLTVTAKSAGSGGNSSKVLLTFSDGVGTLSITQAQLNGSTISVSPTGGISASGGTAQGGGQTYVYLITYVYQSVTYTQPVVGT
jgi:hypothetical protein